MIGVWFAEYRGPDRERGGDEEGRFWSGIAG
jgi:hypothetical protein